MSGGFEGGCSGAPANGQNGYQLCYRQKPCLFMCFTEANPDPGAVSIAEEVIKRVDVTIFCLNRENERLKILCAKDSYVTITSASILRSCTACVKSPTLSSRTSDQPQHILRAGFCVCTVRFHLTSPEQMVILSTINVLPMAMPLGCGAYANVLTVRAKVI